MNKKVLVLDADLGLCNIDVLFGIRHKYNIEHVLNGTKKLKDVNFDGPMIVLNHTTGSGIKELTNINDEQQQRLIQEIPWSNMPCLLILYSSIQALAWLTMFSFTRLC